MRMKFSTENFQTEVLNSELPVLVDFYADWCGPCKMMAPLVEKMAEKYEGRMKIGKLNVEEAMEIAQKYRVANIPTFMFFKNGQAVNSVVAPQSKAAIEDFISGSV